MISKNAEGKSCLDICLSVNGSSAAICAEIIRNQMNQPAPKINVKLMDGSDLDLNLVSGSNTTVEQLQNQIFKVSCSK